VATQLQLTNISRHIIRNLLEDVNFYNSEEDRPMILEGRAC